MTALLAERRLAAFRLLKAGLPKVEVDNMTVPEVEQMVMAEAEARAEDAELLALIIHRGVHGGG